MESVVERRPSPKSQSLRPKAASRLSAFIIGFAILRASYSVFRIPYRSDDTSYELQRY
ncbi:GD21530 [Drosophila simulans]|uniref:GD21530 n=1 Tax=Drosophila simulans TaxID=7240 RepID=B4R276_DROSI|nr:GD21530 [Drosophila simulans]